MSLDFQLEQLQLFSELTTYVGILPSFKDDELYLLSGQIKPFKPNNETVVPLWLALLLKKQQKCKILPPFWMRQSYLQGFYNDQKSNSDLINLQNSQFFQISYIILNNAPDDLDNPTKLRNLIDSIKDVREENIRKKLKNYDGFLINNATTYQLNKFRVAKGMLMEKSALISKLKTSNQ